MCELRWFINSQDREKVQIVSWSKKTDTESNINIIASDSPSTAKDSDHMCKDIIKLPV